MTDRNTPLPTIAHLLGRASAERILKEPYEHQEIYLRSIRSFLVTIEEDGIILDPITLETKLHQLVLRLVGDEE